MIFSTLKNFVRYPPAEERWVPSFEERGWLIRQSRLLADPRTNDAAYTFWMANLYAWAIGIFLLGAYLLCGAFNIEVNLWIFKILPINGQPAELVDAYGRTAIFGMLLCLPFITLVGLMNVSVRQDNILWHNIGHIGINRVWFYTSIFLAHPIGVLCIRLVGDFYKSHFGADNQNAWLALSFLLLTLRINVALVTGISQCIFVVLHLLFSSKNKARP